MSPYVLHPFVRVHICDMNTFHYMAKATNNPGVYNKESAGYLNRLKDHSRSAVDYYLPVSTKSYDLRINAENIAHWDEDFVFDITLPQFFKSSTVVLFELLDYSPSLILKRSKMLNADNLLPLAWGYLRPMGVSQVHLAATKVQLYQYRGNHTLRHK